MVNYSDEEHSFSKFQRCEKHGLQKLFLEGMDGGNPPILILDEAPWHSDMEVKIEKMGTVTINGKKTQNYWDASIVSGDKPLRLKIRNICGDETIFVL